MGTINELNTVDTLADDDKLVLWKTQAGATRAITAIDAATYFNGTPGGPFQPLDELLTAIAGLGPSTAAGDFIELTAQDTVRVRKLSVATYAALTLIPAAFRFDDMLVYVASRATDGDGGEGYWRFDAASSATANGGTILAPDVGSGRWIRQGLRDGSVHLRWWGTDATALQAAFDYMETESTVSRLFIANGTYTIASTCTYSQATLGRSVTIEGEDMMETVLEYTGPATNGMLAFVLGTNANQRGNRLAVRNLAMTTAVVNAGAALKVTRTASATVAPNALYEDLYIYQTGSGYWTYGIWTQDASDQWFNRLYGMHFGASTTAGVYLDNNLTTQSVYGAYFYGCSLNGAVHNIYSTGQLESVYLTDSSFVGATDCLFFDATNTSFGNPHLVIKGCHINGKRRSIYTIDWRAVMISATDVYSGVGSGDVAGSNLLMQGADHVSVTGCKFEHGAVAQTRVHMTLNNCSNISVTGNNMNNATGAGIILTGTTEKVVISGNTIRGYNDGTPNAEGVYNAATGEEFIYSGNLIEYFVTGILSNSSNNLYVGNMIVDCTKGLESVGGTNVKASGNVFANVTTPYTGAIDRDLGFRGCLLYRNAAQTIPSGSATVTWDTEVYDTDNFGAAGGTTFTIPASLNNAKVRLSANIIWEADAGGNRSFVIFKNGVHPYPGAGQDFFDTTTSTERVFQRAQTGIIVVSTGDQFSVQVSQSNTDSSSIDILDGGRCWFQIEVLGQ